MVRCHFCKKETPLPFKCRYCGHYFCVEHHLPESHNCPYLPKIRKPGVPWFQEKLSISRSTIARSHELPIPKRIRVPLELEEDRAITIPKVLFPFNEEWLKFALYNKLEEKGINAFLEPKIPVRKTKLVYYDYGGYLAPTWRERLSRLIPDIVIGEPYLQIWEIENFWKDDISHILKHPYEYERIFGMRAFAFTWRAKWIDRVLNTTYGERQVRDWIVQVDPITGLIKAPRSLYEPGPRPPEDITLECALPGSPEFHSRIQYELAVWLWRKNALVAFEIPISHKGKVYAPDEIVINREEGMIE